MKSLSVPLVFLAIILVVMPIDEANGSYWGTFSKYGCYSSGQAKMAAVLWDIPWGEDWETACASKEATIYGNYYDRPKACRNHSGHMWGEWSVPDSTCL